MLRQRGLPLRRYIMDAPLQPPNRNPHFAGVEGASQRKASLKARNTVVTSLSDPETAKWYLERKTKGEFNARQSMELTGKRRRPITIAELVAKMPISAPTKEARFAAKIAADPVFFQKEVLGGGDLWHRQKELLRRSKSINRGDQGRVQPRENYSIARLAPLVPLFKAPIPSLSRQHRQTDR